MTPAHCCFCLPPCFVVLAYLVVVLVRVQLSLIVCSPFGEYEIDLDILSFSDENSTLERRTSWLIKTGVDEVLN